MSKVVVVEQNHRDLNYWVINELTERVKHVEKMMRLLERGVINADEASSQSIDSLIFLLWQGAILSGGHSPYYLWIDRAGFIDRGRN